MAHTLELILDARATLGEGPSWHVGEGVLYWVDIEGRAIHVYHPGTGRDRTIPVGQMVGAVVPRAQGGLVVVLQDGFYALNPVTGALSLLAAVEADDPRTRFNDGKCDARGRFWAGTMAIADSPEPLGSLYCLEPDLSVRKVLSGIFCSNGIGWSPDNRVMYYIDSPTRKVMAYDYHLDTGTIANPRVVAEIDQGVPDGMTVDEEGMIWVAQWDGGVVSRWNPYTGERLLTVEVPAPRTTSCVFGGPNLDELYITSARTGLDAATLAAYTHSGGLFRASVGVRGLPTCAFAG
ncbi:hypothetical protein GCM10010885_15110 [Alicyclobacillus cellulosilyticus]|uniref:SMP-30/Gluconolactonase/LRE-like region domain-containing protein n=1 Tax=Alicyclobacillus cellulosilyticus TaxID=1003997 RepID=A0A917NK89_9BACL|nr:SMP-30/gluconolactonase/LRE family protein [Alicyclobacillus cellulosilyticus]GGJ06933.1 hypothetical protein GCM10010885_15110 [Alicyclobacillus cellulosilyticus]